MPLTWFNRQQASISKALHLVLLGFAPDAAVDSAMAVQQRLQSIKVHVMSLRPVATVAMYNLSK